MKFDLRKPILGFEGKPMLEMVPYSEGYVPQPGEKPKLEPQKMRAVVHAAIYRLPEGVRRTPEEVERVGQLALKIWKSWKVDLDHKECDFILEKAKVTFASDPLYYVRLKEFLNQQEPEVPEPDDEKA